MSRESSWCPGKWTKQHLSNKAKTLDSKTLQEWKLRKTWCPNTWYQGWASWALVTSLPLRQGCFTGQQTVRAQDGHKKWMPSECTCIASPKYSLQFVERFADDSMINCFGWKRPTADNSYVKWESSIKALKDITAAAFFSHNRISPHLWPRRNKKRAKPTCQCGVWTMNQRDDVAWDVVFHYIPLSISDIMFHHSEYHDVTLSYTFHVQKRWVWWCVLYDIIIATEHLQCLYVIKKHVFLCVSVPWIHLMVLFAMDSRSYPKMSKAQLDMLLETCHFHPFSRW